MTAISITLPEELAVASKEAARRLGVSRASFIRQAIQHELGNLQMQEEQIAMARALLAMQKDANYIKEIQDWEDLDKK